MSALASQCAQHCSDERNFADSGKMCSGVVTLGLVLALVLLQEASTPQICHPWFLASPEGHGEHYCTKTHV